MRLQTVAGVPGFLWRKKKKEPDLRGLLGYTTGKAEKTKSKNPVFLSFPAVLLLLPHSPPPTAAVSWGRR